MTLSATCSITTKGREVWRGKLWVRRGPTGRAANMPRTTKTPRMSTGGRVPRGQRKGGLDRRPPPPGKMLINNFPKYPPLGLIFIGC